MSKMGFGTRKRGSAGNKGIGLLERRLDAVVYRAKPAARMERLRSKSHLGITPLLDSGYVVRG